MRTTVRAILLNQDGKALFVQHNEKNPKDLGKWATVGGGLEPNESHQQALQREIREEFQWDGDQSISIGPLLHRSDRKDRIDYFYAANINCSNFTILEHIEVLEMKWFSKSEASSLNFFFGFEHGLIEKALDWQKSI